MKARKKIVLVIAVAIVVVTLIVSIVCIRSELAMRFFLDYALHRSQQLRVRLLCKTDHHSLLKAGREILSQIPVKERFEHLENRRRDGRRIGGNFGVPKGVRIPQAIRDLRPRGALINYDGFLALEMHGGMDHFGVKIYPDDFREPSRDFKYGDRELLPGLWYYDDGYIHNPEYDKSIETLIEEYKGK